VGPYWRAVGKKNHRGCDFDGNLNNKWIIFVIGVARGAAGYAIVYTESQ